MRPRAVGLPLRFLLLGPGLFGLLGLAGCASAAPDVEAAVFEVSLTNCEQNTSNRATATAITDRLALTVAHSFEGASDVMLAAPDGSELSADLVYLDGDRDIALLSFDGDAAAIEQLEIRSDDDEPADAGRVVVFRDGAAVVRPVQLLRRTVITLDGDGQRQGIELGGLIEPGDSGAPVIDDQGRMIGMIFASSRSTDTGWAVASAELIDVASLAGSPIPLNCPNN